MKQRFHLTRLSCALLGALATPAWADNLLDVYHLAQTNDTVWAQAESDYRANRERGPQGRSLLLPSIVFNASTSKYSVDFNKPTSNSSSYRADTYGVQLTQPLFRWANFAAYSQGKAAVTQAEAKRAVARQDLMLRTAQAYFDVLSAQDTLAFARTQKAAIAGQRELAERNFSVGNATIVDVHEARARYDLAVADEVAAENDVKVKREVLVTLINRDPQTLATLAPKLPLQSPEPENIDHWTQAAADQAPQIKIKELDVKIAQEEVEKSRAGHFPTLDLVAARNHYQADNTFTNIGTINTPTDYDQNQVGLQLQVPIYSGGGVSSRVRESVAREDQAQQSLELAKRQTTQQTREAYLAVTSGVSRVKALEQAQVSTQKALESTLLGYETGVRTGVDVLNAQSELYRTQRDLAQARYAYLVSRLRLKFAVGTLSEADLTEINGLLAGG
jgi:outer membrane protein